MYRHKSALQAICLGALLFILVMGSCSKGTFMASPPVPYVPVEYYSCIEVDPQVLLEAYYSNYNAVSQTEQKYNGKIFVFKNLEVTDTQVTAMKKGYFWAYTNKCTFANSAAGKSYKVGDKVDVVGINQGLSNEFRGLVFSDCYILPTGSVALPASGAGGSFSAGY
jgi:hypothetical protein